MAYIEKEALIKFISDTRYQLPKDSADFHTRDLMLLNFEQYVNLQPIADVEEVKHGEWYQHNKKEHGDTCFYCSVCEKMALSDCLEWELTNYCPHCGADMRGDTK